MRRLALAVCLLSLASTAAAETAYVTDILRLGIHEAENTSDRAFDSLVSGTPLEILERIPNYARVETPDGRVGWVKSAYLVEEKPAQLRVAELETRIADLEAALERAEAARAEAERRLAGATERDEARAGSAAAIQETLARLKTENHAYERRLETYRGAVPLAWAAAALVVCLVGGIAGGIWWLDARIRRRYGGYRVY